MKRFRSMIFTNLNVWVRVYEKEFINKMISLLNGLDDFQSFDHLLSFDIKQNYNNFIKSSFVIKDKPERVNMKFQSFDYKFALHYIDRSIFNDAIILIRNFYGYRFQIKYLYDTKNQYIRRSSLNNFN